MVFNQKKHAEHKIYSPTSELPKKPINHVKENALYGKLVDTKLRDSIEKTFLKSLELADDDSLITAPQQAVIEGLFPKRSVPLQTLHQQVDSSSLVQFGRVLTVIQPDIALLEKTENNQQQFILMKLSVAQQKVNAIKLLSHESEKLLIPLTILVNKKEQKALNDYQEQLKFLGFDFYIDKAKLHLHNVPKMLRTTNWQKLLPMLIALLLSSGKDVLDPTQIATWLVENGDDNYAENWSIAKTIELLAQLDQIDNNLLQQDIFLYPIDLKSFSQSILS